MAKDKKLGKKLKKFEKEVNENIINIPNSLTTLRVLITFIIIYIIFFRFNLIAVVILFIAGMITDFLDGNIARIFNMKTEFGRKFDMIADRFLLIATIVSLIIYQIINGRINNFQVIQILFIMSREIIAFPVAINAFFRKKEIPKVRLIGKATTVLQAIAFPAILLNLNFSIYLAILTGIIGIASGIIYILDVSKANK